MQVRHALDCTRLARAVKGKVRTAETKTPPKGEGGTLGDVEKIYHLGIGL